LCEHDFILENLCISRFEIQVKIWQTKASRKDRFGPRWGSDNPETSKNPFLFVTVTIINMNSFVIGKKMKFLEFH